MIVDGIKRLLTKHGSADQATTEAFIALATLMYKADGKVKESEQAMFENITRGLEWNDPNHPIEAFHSRIIGEVNLAISNDDVKQFISKYCQLLSKQQDVLDKLQSLSEADGNVDEREAYVLEKIAEHIKQR